MFSILECKGSNYQNSFIDTMIIPIDTIFFQSNVKSDSSIRMPGEMLSTLLATFFESIRFKTGSPFIIMAKKDILPKTNSWKDIKLTYYSNLSFGESTKYNDYSDALIIQFPFSNSDLAIKGINDLDKLFYPKDGSLKEGLSYYLWFRIKKSIIFINTSDSSFMDLIMERK
ncbi:MAG: hypothetical protein ABI761_17215 [Saprospiraceae bacterium]